MKQPNDLCDSCEFPFAVGDTASVIKVGGHRLTEETVCDFCRMGYGRRVRLVSSYQIETKWGHKETKQIRTRNMKDHSC